ncbi:PA2778 family cysteine peptidase [Thiohalobacter thiocyanaticus]|uniref:Tetratricopeptide repeat protein n=1 Tax=Thiohalobacter thiocyanaticus TaxID=585455 RepID=A0A426QJ00_9GAMM|nr:PA2778 family cysteine peptidase [Thiohalobacter thiocyanaticus]RRQ21725.1 tetratricopeptide repeat protein [Thiohalobacter thiocyanaticus]
MPRIGVWLAAALLLAGCASQQPLTEGPGPEDRTPVETELVSTPFHPQQDYQCGPAALATVLNAAGVEIMPEALTPDVYLPGRRGSLQTELIAAARQHGRVPYQLTPEVEALIRQLQAGHPVLVLQNLSIAALPRWHYAVVIGYSSSNDQFILRSGTERRKRMDRNLFLRTWRRADHWALVVLPPERLPADPDPERYIQSVAGLEATGQIEAARRAYRTASRHWPDASAAWYGLGNTHYLSDEFAAAESAYRKVLALDPDNAAAHNNLARALLARGCTDAAMETVRAALELTDTTPAIRRALEATRREIAAAATSAPPEPADCPSGFRPDTAIPDRPHSVPGEGGAPPASGGSR